MDELVLVLGASAARTLSDAFGELRHLHSAFDSDEEARSLLRTVLPPASSEAFITTATESLMHWKRTTATVVKRQCRMQLERASERLLTVGEPLPARTALDYEDIIRNDPKVFLEVAKRVQKRKSDGILPGTRAEKEDKERNRFALELGSIIEEACLPVSLQIVELKKPEMAWLRIWGNRRSKTLRNRYRAWSKYRSWLIATYGLVWPKNLSQVINFMEELIEFGCPVSFPGEFFAAFALLEQVGKVAETHRISTDPMLGEHMKSWKLALAGTSNGRGAARPYTVAILVALELFTVNEEAEVFFRFISWLMLLANWASLRVDDIQNIQPETLRMSTRGLSFKMSRTKTTGPGRLHGAIHGFVARDITITGEDWMATGMIAMQREDMRFPRDYLAPGPTKDFGGFVPKVVEPPELANYFRMVLSKLFIPRHQEGKWLSNDQTSLVPETTNLFWTGHSARHFLTQAAAAIGISKEQRDYLGRWAIGRIGSNAYLHTSRQVVEKIQKEVLNSLYGADGYNEDELLDDLKEFSEKQGLVGYRVRRKHKILPIDRVDPCLLITEDSEGDLTDDEACRKRVEAAVEAEPNLQDNTSLPSAEDTVGYYVTISRRNGFRRLHMAGACPVRAWKCQEMEQIIDVRQAAYDAVCLNCKRRIQLQEGAAEDDEESDSVGDSTSTESDLAELEEES